MNGKIITVLMAVWLVTLSGDAFGENKGTQSERAVLGVQLDPSGLGELLRKHLRLKESEGLLVRNIQIDSQAANAGACAGYKNGFLRVAFLGHRWRHLKCNRKGRDQHYTQDFS